MGDGLLLTGESRQIKLRKIYLQMSLDQARCENSLPIAPFFQMNR